MWVSACMVVPPCVHFEVLCIHVLVSCLESFHSVGGVAARRVAVDEDLLKVFLCSLRHVVCVCKIRFKCLCMVCCQLVMCAFIHAFACYWYDLGFFFFFLGICCCGVILNVFHSCCIPQVARHDLIESSMQPFWDVSLKVAVYFFCMRCMILAGLSKGIVWVCEYNLIVVTSGTPNSALNRFGMNAFSADCGANKYFRDRLMFVCMCLMSVGLNINGNVLVSFLRTMLFPRCILMARFGSFCSCGSCWRSWFL